MGGHAKLSTDEYRLMEGETLHLLREAELRRQDIEFQQEQEQRLEEQIRLVEGELAELRALLENLQATRAEAEVVESERLTRLKRLATQAGEHFGAVAAEYGVEVTECFARFAAYCEGRGCLTPVMYRRHVRAYLGRMRDPVSARLEGEKICRVLGLRDVPTPRSNVYAFPAERRSSSAAEG